MTSRQRMRRDDAEQTYIGAGELEVFRQLQRDALALDDSLAHEQAVAVGPFARLRTDAVVDALGKTRGAINNVWGSQESFRAAVLATFLNDVGIGLHEVDLESLDAAADVDEWVSLWAAVELERGPRHGMAPENRYGLRWAAWLGLAPYGLWSELVAAASLEEYRITVAHLADDVIAPALDRFGLTLAGDTTLDDVALAAASTIEGFWLNACLTDRDPAGRQHGIGRSLAVTLRTVVRGAVAPAP